MNDCISTLDTIGDQLRKLTGNSNLTDDDIDQMLMVDKARKRNRKRVAKNNRRKEKAMSLLAHDDIAIKLKGAHDYDLLYIEDLAKHGYDIEIRSFLKQWHVIITHNDCSASVVDAHILDGVHIALDLISNAGIENYNEKEE